MRHLTSILIVLVLVLATAGCGRQNHPEDDQGVPDAPGDPNREIGKCCGSTWECATKHCTAAPLMGDQWVCSKECWTNADCPVMSACQRIGDGSGGFQTVCLPCELVSNTNARACPMEAGAFKCFK